MRTIELLARGALIHNGYILLAHQKGAKNTFLPGGHIKFGEPAEATLKREIQEELTASVQVKQLLGVVEHSWGTEDDFHHEFNLIFVIDCEELSSNQSPISREAHLEFLWQSLNNLASVN